jgi:hypothetical protein
MEKVLDVTATETLLVQLPPKPDESIFSLLQRHAQANAVGSMRDMLWLLESKIGYSVFRVQDLLVDATGIGAVEHLLGLPSPTLAHHYLHPFPGPEKRVRQGLHEWSRHARVPETQHVCPECLAADGYARAAWDFVQAPVCTIHHCQLIDRCPKCTTKLSFARTNLLVCEHCDTELHNGAGMPVSESTSRAAHLVQGPRILSMGNVHDTCPVNPQDLSDFLRLCTLPAPGMPWTYSLEGGLAAVPLRDRVAALTRLGSAVDGRHIDPDKLRAQVMQRWPYSAALPKDEQTRLLRAACGMMEVPRDTANLLCFGSEQEADKTAAECYGPRIPHLRSRLEVEEFLAADAGMLNGLLQSGLPLTTPAEAQGYDMDEVLAIRRALQSVMTLDEVDHALGFVGLSEALLALKLLSGVRMPSGELRVLPSSLSTLLSRVFAASENEPENARNGVEFLRASSLGVDTAQLAWIVSQILGGSLRVFAWRPPYTLASVWVEGTRLEQLADWPSSEMRRRLSTADSTVEREMAGAEAPPSSEALPINAGFARSVDQ